MSLLMYNLEPASQLFRNASFESPLMTLDGPLNWVKNDKATRQTEVKAFGGFAVELLPEGKIYQRSPELNLSGQVTVSILTRGKSSESESRLFVKYEKIDSSGNVLVSKQQELTSISSSEFNITYTVFSLPAVASSEGKVTFFTSPGIGTYYLDNSKSEQGRQPTRWSPFSGEPEVEGIPTTFRADTTFVDPNDFFGSPTNLNSVVIPPKNVTVDSKGVAPQQDRSGSPVEGIMIGRDSTEAFNQFHEFSVSLKEIHKECMDQAVNREGTKYFPNDKDLEFLDFTRDKLQAKVDDPAIDSRQKTFLLAAKTKMAGQRRMFEVRNHDRMDQYTFGFNALWHDYKYLRDEDGMIRYMVGA